MSNAISRLSPIDTIDGATQIPVSINGQDLRITPATLNTYLQAITTSVIDKTTQYSAPAATAFSVQVTDSSVSTWLILTPLATYADGTIVMPSLTSSVNKQEVLVNCTQIVTNLVVDGNGSTVVGAPTTLAANDSFRLRYDSTLATWYSV